MQTLIKRETLKDQPVYCETLQAGDAVNTYLSEPVNAYSNAFIFIAVAVCMVMLWKNRDVLPKPRIAWLGFGVFCLFLNALGSWLWHSTKDTGWLPLDVFPAIVFLLIIVYYWFQKIFTVKSNILLATLSLLVLPAVWVLLAVTVFDLRNTKWLPIGFTLTFLTLFISYITLSWQRLPNKNMYQGLWALAAMVFAAFFRGIDTLTAVCETIPFGTHFLWHFGLSVSAVLGLRFILGLQHIQKNSAVS